MSIFDLLGGAMRLWGAHEDRQSSERNADRNIALQREFAQNGISWRVQDARNSGIHPLAALGASTTSFSPVTVGSNLADAYGSAGQDFGRAINATMSAPDRSKASSKAAEALTLERGQLENELLRTQIASQTAKLGQAGGNPAMQEANSKYLVEGQGPTVEVKPIDEKKKFEDRPKMMIGGRRILTDPLTSNVESAEDRYGDEGPAQWMMQAATAWQDLKHNINQGNLTRQDVVEWITRQAKWIDKNTKVFGR